ncbi:hypothetical protein ACZ87_02402 [Candidatus Erwinia dacicola]|uniref:Uncharacterized protein n=1 Tax=Candidatus Erwinia dacicola TaxID=252393 RepID=A0A328TMV0_9GAMM|nr:hypothetical protein ACZ87_02402 [Candidatus Erwinia dacicola]
MTKSKAFAMFDLYTVWQTMLPVGSFNNLKAWRIECDIH